MKRLVLLIALLACSPSLWASCVASTSGAWTTGGNWTGCAGSGGVPASTDAVTIGNTFSMTCGGTCAASTLTTAGTGKVDVQSGGTLTVTTTVTLAGTGTSAVDTGGQLNVGTILTIGSGTTMHVDGGTLWIQTGASTTTADLVVTGSGTTVGTLTVDTNGHIYLAGAGTFMRSTAVNLYGSNPLTFCPKQAASSTICNTTGTATALSFKEANTSATNVATLNICPTSSCNSNTQTTYQTLAGPVQYNNCSASVELDQIPAGSSTSGSIQFVIGNTGFFPTLVTNCMWLHNFGSTSVNTGWAENNTSAAQSITMINTFVDNSGQFIVTKSGTATGQLIIDGLTIVNGINTGAHQFGTLQNLVNTAGDIEQRIALVYDNNLAQSMSFQFDAAGYQCGGLTQLGDSLNIPCVWSYNVPVLNTATLVNNASMTLRDTVFVIDSLGGNGSYPCLQIDPSNSETVQGSLALVMAPNAHCHGESSAVVGSTSDLWQWIYGDGNGFKFADTGNFISSNGVSSVENSLFLNDIGESVNNNLGGSGPFGVSVLNTTNYSAEGITFGSTGSTEFTNIRNNLFTWPSIQSAYDDYGVAAVVGNTGWLRQTKMATWDYNAFYGQVCSGDPGAGSCTGSLAFNPLTNPTLGVQGYMGPALSGTATLNKTTVSVSSPCNAGCTVTWSGAVTTMQAYDYLCPHVNTNGAACDDFTVNSTTSVSLVHGIPGLSTGNGVDIYWQYIDSTNTGLAGNAQYGVTAGFGTHDQHINPQYRQSGADACSWLARQGLITNLCSHTQENTILSSSTTTDLKSGVDATGWGIVNGTTQIGIFETGGLTRCISTITNVTATDITMSPACGTAAVSTDKWAIVDATRYWGLQIGQMNGWTAAGVPNNPMASAYDPVLGMQYLMNAYTPMNGSLKNAAYPSDCPTLCDVGFVPVYPAAIIQ